MNWEVLTTGMRFIGGRLITAVQDGNKKSEDGRTIGFAAFHTTFGSTPSNDQPMASTAAVPSHGRISALEAKPRSPVSTQRARPAA